MKIHFDKLKLILLYFANHCQYLGKIKLMKLFYFLDFMHVKKYGRPITFDTYVNLEKGPIPSTIYNIVTEAIEDPEFSQLADVVHFETPEGTRMNKMTASRKFTKEDEKYFSEIELETIKKVCLMYGHKLMRSVRDESHNQAPWRKTRYLDEIPYSLAAYDADSEVTKEEIETLLKIYD